MNKYELLDRETIENMLEAIMDTLQKDSATYDEKFDTSEVYDDYRTSQELQELCHITESLKSRLNAMYAEVRPK